MINLQKGEINTNNDEEVEKLLEDLDNPLIPDDEDYDEGGFEDLDDDDFQLRIAE